jgi:histidine ammonia-lyase
MNHLSIFDFEQIIFNQRQYNVTPLKENKLQESFSFLKRFSADKIIYGINTGFGPMAQFRIKQEDLSGLQYNLVRSHCTGLGAPLEASYARSVLLARLNAFIQCKSGISPMVVEKLVAFLNANIAPEIFEHGSVGASGDLVQLAHLALNLIGEGFVYVNGERVSAKIALSQANIEPLKLELRDGLGLINGTSCMTGIGLINLIYAKRLVNWSISCSAIINELVESYDDSISEQLNDAKLHVGQKAVAKKMRTLLSDSKLIKKRVELFNNPDSTTHLTFEKKIQEYYSIRCVPQILGPVYDTLGYSEKVLVNELNSTNDNPIIDLESQNVFHGGNFHGDYVSLEMDKVKTVITKLSILSERQLNFLLNPALNNQFPAFLNLQKLGFNFGLQAAQFSATSTVAENQTLSFPNYVHSIPNNNDNQDVVSMGTNSATLTAKVIENTFQVMAIHLMAVCQAIDLLDSDKKDLISSHAKMIYKEVRALVDSVTNDRPLSSDIQKLIRFVKTKNLDL